MKLVLETLAKATTPVVGNALAFAQQTFVWSAAKVKMLMNAPPPCLGMIDVVIRLGRACRR